MATFVSELRRLSEHCKFGETLEERLRDRIICGIANNQLQRRLLAEPDLTFKKVLELAQAQESADQGSQQLQQQQKHSVTPVNKIDGRRRPPPQPWKVIPGKPCYRCGGSHSPSECRFKDAVCHSCNKTGHIAKACRRQKQRPSPPHHQNRHQSKSTHQVERGDAAILEDPTDGSYELFNLQGTRSKPLTITVQVNQTDLQMEIDTGAAVSLISEKTYKTQWSSQMQPKLKASDVRLHTYTKERTDVLGSIVVEVVHKGQRKSLQLLVVAGEGPSLFGRDWLMELQLDWCELYRVQQSTTLQEILNHHAPVFKEELGEAKGVTAKLQ